MDDNTCRIHGEIVIRNDSCVMPSVLRIIIHDEHVVCKDAAEAKLALIEGLFFQVLGACDRNGLHGKFLHINCYF